MSLGIVRSRRLRTRLRFLGSLSTVECVVGRQVELKGVRLSYAFSRIASYSRRASFSGEARIARAFVFQSHDVDPCLKYSGQKFSRLCCLIEAPGKKRIPSLNGAEGLIRPLLSAPVPPAFTRPDETAGI